MPTDVIRRAILQGLHAHGYTDLTPAHFPVLRYPGPQGQRPVDLAAQVGMTKQAMNYLLGQLETLGYLERRVDPGDTPLATRPPHRPRRGHRQGHPRHRPRHRSNLDARAGRRRHGAAARAPDPPQHDRPQRREPPLRTALVQGGDGGCERVRNPPVSRRFVGLMLPVCSLTTFEKATGALACAMIRRWPPTPWVSWLPKGVTRSSVATPRPHGVPSKRRSPKARPASCWRASPERCTWREGDPMTRMRMLLLAALTPAERPIA
jgi:hypothetical protein